MRLLVDIAEVSSRSFLLELGGESRFFFFNKYEILCFYQTLGCEQTSKYGRGRDMSVSKATFKQSSDQVTPAGHMTTACALVMWPPNATWSHSFPESDKESVIVLPPWGMRGVREYNKFSVSKEITREKHCLVPSHKMDLCFCSMYEHADRLLSFWFSFIKDDKQNNISLLNIHRIIFSSTQAVK